jgi:hypothetical protein
LPNEIIIKGIAGNNKAGYRVVKLLILLVKEKSGQLFLGGNS